MAQFARDAIPKHERARESGGARPVVSDNTGPETAKEGAMGAVARKASEAVGARMNATAERWWYESDAMHALLIKRCDELMGCTEGSEGSPTRSRHEVRRWADGKGAGRKGAS